LGFRPLGSCSPTGQPVLFLGGLDGVAKDDGRGKQGRANGHRDDDHGDEWTGEAEREGDDEHGDGQREQQVADAVGEQRPMGDALAARSDGIDRLVHDARGYGAMTAQYESLLFDVAERVATITINRPDKRNALNAVVITELRAAFAAAKADAAVGAVVLAGAGDRAFCAGADLSGVIGEDSFVAEHDRRGDIIRLFLEMWALGKPTIGRVQGFALAGGFGLALACDLIVASDAAVFGTPEIDVGMWPMMITVPMLRSMPPKVALELQMTARRVGAEEAQRIGFVSRVVPMDELDAATYELARAVASKSPAILRLGRDAFYAVLDQRAEDAFKLLQAGLTMVNQTEDSKEGIRAFVEKRSPNYTGR